MRWMGWLGLWVVSLGVGEVFLTRFQTRPGTIGAASMSWPADTTIERRAGRATLVLFLHPFCPCSRATLAELERVAARCPDRADVRLVVSWDSDQAPESKVELMDETRTIPNSTAQLDLGAKEARRFGAQTSGMAFLYDASGKLLFEGGITASRGHEGDNEGEEALVDALEHGMRHRGALPVYGCPICGVTR